MRTSTIWLLMQTQHLWTQEADVLIVLLNEIKQELSYQPYCFLATVQQKFEVQVYRAIKCGKLDTVTTQCRLGSVFDMNSVVEVRVD